MPCKRAADKEVGSKDQVFQTSTAKNTKHQELNMLLTSSGTLPLTKHGELTKRGITCVAVYRVGAKGQTQRSFINPDLNTVLFLQCRKLRHKERTKPSCHQPTD